MSKKFVIYVKKRFSADNKNYYRGRDHCHYTGKYREDALNACNLNNKAPKEFPVVFHNGSFLSK